MREVRGDEGYMKQIELLSPARDLQTGMEAILHGADAVYIGAPRYGARASAGNSVEDIRKLVDFAHPFGVRVYVTLNTILFDDELEDAHQLALQLAGMGVDALIVQDLAFLKMGLPIELHASTQMDNRTAEKVRWLGEQGFRQAVLARELTLNEISAIHRQVPEVALEAFVHGATCVCYNGQCYASQHCFGRSANRGGCAQFCRLPFDLIDDEGRDVRVSNSSVGLMHQRHLLSLHDMNRSGDLEALLDAGVVSLKIEGRLKDSSYVKNVTAYYRQRLDEIIDRRPGEYKRSSLGRSRVSFVPNLARSFNRGFSDYFLHGRTSDMVQLSTPKSLGEAVGHVKEVRRNCFTVSGVVPFNNGDGLCFLDDQGHLQGFRVNRVEGNCLYPKEMPRGLCHRMPLFRNYDQVFEQQLSHPTATRKIAVSWLLQREGDSFLLAMNCEDGLAVQMHFECELQAARIAQQEAVSRQLDRLGDTIYETTSVRVSIPYDEISDCFIPSSLLASWRRTVVEQMNEARKKAHSLLPSSNASSPQIVSSASSAQLPSSTSSAVTVAYAGKQSSPGHLTYLANVANHLAQEFFLAQGIKEIDPAFEVQKPKSSQDTPAVLMTTRYCIRYELGLCPHHHGVPAQTLKLRSADGRIFPLRFDCKNCMMQVLAQ